MAAVDIGVAQCRTCAEPVTGDGFELRSLTPPVDAAIFCAPACVATFLWLAHGAGPGDFHAELREVLARVVQRMIDAGELDPRDLGEP